MTPHAMTRRHGKDGSALPMVMAFVLLLFITAGVSAFQTSGIRRLHSKSQLCFYALEVAQSAIDEAAFEIAPPATDSSTARAGIEKVLPPSTFGTVEEFLEAIRKNEPPRGVAADKVDFRNIRYSSGKVEKLFAGLTFPGTAVTVPMTGSKTRKLYAGKLPIRSLSSVVATPLRFRREHYTGSRNPGESSTGRWVNWGVIQFKVAVEIGDRGNSVVRVVTVDRLFKLAVPRNTTYWTVQIGRSDQRTVIRGTRRPGDPA